MKAKFYHFACKEHGLVSIPKGKNFCPTCAANDGYKLYQENKKFTQPRYDGVYQKGMEILNNDTFGDQK